MKMFPICLIKLSNLTTELSLQKPSNFSSPLYLFSILHIATGPIFNNMQILSQYWEQELLHWKVFKKGSSGGVELLGEPYTYNYKIW